MLPLRRDHGEIPVCGSAGKGFRALHGVGVKWCPRAGHGALPVGAALGWAGNR